jgi:hypothetical protein
VIVTELVEDFTLPSMVACGWLTVTELLAQRSP